MENYQIPRPFPVSLEPVRQPTYSKEDIRGAELGEEIATLSAQLQVATYRLPRSC